MLTRFFPLVLLIFIALAGSAFAQAIPKPPLAAPALVQEVSAARDACRHDARRLCRFVLPGGGRIVRCLGAQMDVLSPGCYDAMASLREAIHVCRGDAVRLCPGVVPGGGRIVACLDDQMAAVSHHCRASLRQAQQIWSD
jgi:hypothetical protein